MPRAQTAPTRAWLTAARRAGLGAPRTPSPSPHLTATRHFAPRCTPARRGRARLRALFCTVRYHPAPVAVRSTARHALPDPCYYPVHATVSQTHAVECKARPAEHRRRTATCRPASRPPPRPPATAEARRITSITRKHIRTPATFSFYFQRPRPVIFFAKTFWPITLTTCNSAESSMQLRGSSEMYGDLSPN